MPTTLEPITVPLPVEWQFARRAKVCEVCSLAGERSEGVGKWDWSADRFSSNHPAAFAQPAARDFKSRLHFLP
jgi:hypothetical protein